MAIRVKYSIMSIMNAPLLGAIFGGHQLFFKVASLRDAE